MVHQVGKGFVIHRFRQVDPVGARQFRLHHFPDSGILVYREDGRRFRMILQHRFQRPVHLPHGFPQVFPAVGGHEDQPLPAGQGFVNDRISKSKLFPHRGMQRIDDGIARYKDAVLRHIFFQ